MEIFSEKELQKKAVESGFYKRSCDFTPAKFFDLLIYCASHAQTFSLSQASVSAFEASGHKITKQSIDKRFNQGAVAFVLSVLKDVLEKQLSKVLSEELLPQFKKIRIKDSTKFNVDKRLSPYFKGSGGRCESGKACVCIQYEFDLRSGKILDLNVTSGTRNDCIDARETKEKIDKKDLVLRDLGYWNLSVVNHFVSECAFFISRLSPSNLVYDLETNEKMDFKKLYTHMKKYNLNNLEKQVLIGKEEKSKFRMILTVVPEKIYEDRIKRANKKNKENGWQTSEAYKARCRFNLFITNISQEDTSQEEILLIYRMRWQVELMFKNWKSVCAIHKLHPMKYERFTCLLLAKLILIVLNLQIIRNLQEHHFRVSKKLLSENKCFKTLQNSFGLLKSIWKEKRNKSRENLQKLLDLFSSNHWKEERKNNKNLLKIMDLFICKSIYYDYI